MNKEDFKAKTSRRPGTPWLFLALIVFVLTAVIGSSALPRTLAAEDVMVVYQQKDGKIFGLTTSLDIFDDPKLGGQKLVHPFTKGTYTFAVFNNSGSALLPYALDIIAENPDNIPLVFSVQKNGVYVFGGADKASMLPITEINFPEISLGGKKTDTYTLKWEWKTESDAQDTAIGNIGTQLYTLTIRATGTISEGEGPGTGDAYHRLLWVMLILVCVLLLFLLLYKRRKDEDEETVQAAAENR